MKLEVGKRYVFMQEHNPYSGAVVEYVKPFNAMLGLFRYAVRDEEGRPTGKFIIGTANYKSIRPFTISAFVVSRLT